ncbi:MAG: DUF1320 domain-containing protein [Deltaproteobacteria bacterium]|nr:DUF1320 domain-containing protein [Deltaproteobacteria bacterium]
MPYCSQDDLKTIIPIIELAELSADTGNTPDSVVVAEMIRKADAEIDSYLANRYQTPFSPVPEIIRSLSMDMALYHLYSRRSAIPAIRLTKYQDAVRFLREVAVGQINIGGAAESEGAAALSEPVELVGSKRVFSRAAWGKY